MHAAIRAGNVAVITGAGFGGIGYSLAQTFAQAKMRVALIDNSAEHLSAAVSGLKLPESEVLSITADVADFEELQSAAKQVGEKFGKINVVCLNAGTAVRGGGNTWSGRSDVWQKVLGVNLFGIVNGSNAFVKSVVDTNEPGLVIVTGSKQGITNPPTGDAAYNVSKAGVKAFAEQLAHELREETDGRVSAHLLVPGWTFTKLTRGDKKEKPDGAWYPQQVVDYAMPRIEKGDFYIICPDNDVNSATDNARMEWSANDPAQNRPALSRWSKEYKQQFEHFMKAKTGK